MTIEDYRAAYMDGYLAGLAEEQKTAVMTREAIIQYFKDVGVELSDGKAYEIIRSVRENFNGGILGSPSMVTKPEFLAWLNTVTAKKVRI